ncbi:hypothetical protein H6F77_11685 [Microcoleus sp. FACHB-831]|uniref:hypothetical protein n=1 Tax=Microcoleus sp. FACHB-831 TaxID=2692827 RepID=UPI0016834346|nr:hypothetical protein [Microcoleus sp. FACHB-831]MBD1921753.1 hypothetical protein [Microcoleus sp. FACHB-831]
MLYYPPKDGQIYGQLFGKFEDFSGKVTFSEGKLQKSDNGYILYCWAEEVTDVEKQGDRAWKWEPAFIQIPIHAKEYEKSTKLGDTWKKENVTPQYHEVYFCKIFAADEPYYLSEEKNLKGFLKFDSYGGKHLLTGIDNNGRPLPEQTLEFLRDNAIYIEHCEPDKIKGLPEVKKKGSWGGGYSESATVRLESKWKFVIDKLAPYPDGTEPPKNLKDLACYLYDIKHDWPDVGNIVEQLVIAIFES